MKATTVEEIKQLYTEIAPNIDNIIKFSRNDCLKIDAKVFKKIATGEIA